MTYLDYALIVIVLGSAVLGLVRGLFREAMSLAVWVAAIWAAGRYADWAAPYMARWIDSPALGLWAARLAVLVGVLLAGGTLSWLVAMVIRGGRLGAPDRAAGMAFGLARGALLVGVVMILLQAAGFSTESWWRESKLVPYAAPVADALREAAEQELGKPGSLSAPQPPARRPDSIGG